ncbi:sigma-54-dependent Fis family transcriptional regulator [Ahniella affigens]|uniref:Sigma-54-dependent Fis family transcriptional regulator n=1 Tax=Ahniella affigens TaxID=2021234 RepID=A0A2P1PY04_9GAMM|nr:sigma-54 dependent transcriptional regulator [Ahniella affigens]AVP99737.1 sigma-54-dependent Fis family transcriptional regulator [Ahniella affigens]
MNAISSKLPILICDDQRDVLEALRFLLKSEGLQAQMQGDPDNALSAVRRQQFACALIDLNYSRDTTSGQEGIDLLRRLKALDADLPVVVMTAWGSIHLAVQAMQAGAADFIEKPWDNHRLLSILRTQIALGEERRRNARLHAENALLRSEQDEAFVAASKSMLQVMEMLKRVAPTDANVLILGENGTGKSVLAKRLHAASTRAERSLIKVNMGGIPEQLFESEMFGHVKGAFTDAKQDRVGRFELADGGTLFLDEIGNIPPSQQPKLLRVLEDGELERVGSSRTARVDVRLVSATNADLRKEVQDGRFRKDLLFRLNTVELVLPPLRDRLDDLPLLAEVYLERFAKRYQRGQLTLAPSALRELAQYHWPGNVRELSHVLERAALLSHTDQISALHLSQAGEPVVPGASPTAGPTTLDDQEEALIRDALKRHQGNIQRSAEALGLSRAALYRRLEKFGIRGED